MKRNLWIGGTVLVLCGAVAIGALSGSTTSNVAFAKVAEMKDRCEVYGILDKKSIQSLKGGNLVRFELAEEKTGRRLEVLYDNPVIALTANFPAASHARAKGVYDPATSRLVADEVITKCPSKYNQEMDLTTQTAVQRWQKESGLKPEGDRTLLDRG